MVKTMLRALSTTVNIRKGCWEALCIEVDEVNEVDADDMSLGSVGKS